MVAALFATMNFQARIDPEKPALALAPMDGITDAPMRALQGESRAFSFAVSEFVRVSTDAIPPKVFRREIPEVEAGGLTPTGMPVQVQILGGDPELMAQSALNAIQAGATSIDINFGCPAPTVNRHDGGATILKYPCRVRDLVRAVRDAVPAEIPVSAKVRLGWESIDDIYENAAMAEEGGASGLTIHARTRVQGDQAPGYWSPIGKVREQLSIPVVANGDIWTFEDYLRCREETGCMHFMIGRSALANPSLPYQIAQEMGIREGEIGGIREPMDWIRLFERLNTYVEFYRGRTPGRSVARLKQWLNLAARFGGFEHFDAVKRLDSLDELMEKLAVELGVLARA